MYVKYQILYVVFDISILRAMPRYFLYFCVSSNVRQFENKLSCTQTYKNAAKITKINYNNLTSPQASIELVLLILKTFKSSITVHRKSAKSLTLETFVLLTPIQSILFHVSCILFIAEIEIARDCA